MSQLVTVQLVLTELATTKVDWTQMSLELNNQTTGQLIHLATLTVPSSSSSSSSELSDSISSIGGPAGAALRGFLTGGGLGKALSESLSDSGSVDLDLVADLEDLVDLVAVHHSEQKLNAPQVFKQVSVLCVHMGVE